MAQYGVYKYVTCDTNEIIYIGKTNTSFDTRFIQHYKGFGLDKKFEQYADKCKIYVALLPNSTEAYLLEKALINKYKPILNRADNREGFSNYIQVIEPVWIEYHYVPPVKKKKEMEPHGDNTRYGTIFLGYAFNRYYYLIVYKPYKDKFSQIYCSAKDSIILLKHMTILCNQDNEKVDCYSIPAKDMLWNEYYKSLDAWPIICSYPPDSYYSSSHVLISAVTFSDSDWELDEIRLYKNTIDMLKTVIPELEKYNLQKTTFSPQNRL